MKKLLFVVTALLFVFTLSACDKTEDVVVEKEALTVVKFGVIGPLTGEYSMYGVAVQRGAELAAAEINAAGGILGVDLEIIAYDSKGDATEGVNAYNKLRDDDKVNAVIGGTFSGVTLAIKELAVEDGMPILTPTATNPDVTLDAANVFRACYTDSYQGSVAATFAADTLGAESVAILFNRDDAYSEGLATAFADTFDAKGLSYTTFEFGAADDDYSAQLTNIKNGDFDAVFVPAYVAEVGKILTQADQLGLEVPFIGGDGWDGIEADYAAVAEGNYFANHYAKTDEAQVVQDFVANYEAAYGEAPNALAALAYDAVYVMAATMDSVKSVDPDTVVAALSAYQSGYVTESAFGTITFPEAVTGAISFDENGDPVKSITIIQVVGGEHVVATKVEASE